MESGRSPFNVNNSLAEKIKKASDVEQEINYTDSTRSTISSFVYTSVKLGYTLTETITNDGAVKTITRLYS